MKKLLLSLAVVLAGCGGGGDGTSPTQPIVQVFNSNLKPNDLKLNCVTKSNMQSANGLYYGSDSHVDYNVSQDYYVNNNFWGVQMTENYANFLNSAWSQCMGAGFSDKNTVVSKLTWDMGTNSSWNGGVKTSPFIDYGYNPENKHNGTTFPKQIASIKSLQVNWNIEIDKNNSIAHFMLDTWISSTATPNRITDSSMVAEMMIVFDCWPNTDQWCNPTGEKVNIGGYDYIFRLENAPFPGNPRFITFDSLTPQLGKGGINLTLFLDFLKSRGVLNNTHYIDDLEFGTEIIAGKGELRLNSYSVTVN